MPKKKYNTPEEKKAATLKNQYAWKKKNNKIISVRFNIGSDKEVLEQIGKQKNKADYLRKLILKDIEESK